MAIFSSPLPGAFVCSEGDVRLVGNNASQGTGRLEICHTNIWGTVCGGDDWDLVDSQVACRQLGYTSGLN